MGERTTVKHGQLHRSLLEGKFGATVYAARLHGRHTQAYVAAAAGISAGYLSELENSKRRPPVRKVTLRLGSALGLSEEELEQLACLADLERSAHSHDAHLPLAVQELIVDLRVFAFELPEQFVDAMRAQLKETCM